MELHWIDHIIFGIFGLLFPINSMFSTQPKLAEIEEWEPDMKQMLYISNSISLLVMALIVLAAWYFTDRTWPDIGLQMPVFKEWIWPLIFFIIFNLLYVLDAWLELRSKKARLKAHAHWKKHTPFLPENMKEMIQFIPLAFSAGINEEIVFRGFFINYFLMLFVGHEYQYALALAIPSILFAIVHYYQGWKAVLKIGILSIFFGLLYITTQSLLIPIILHVLIDLIGGVISWKYLSKEVK
ncbi:MAG: CPBP family intramembrane metalloprotease [Saprospiraceae bacterium]|nr:CPBP family intramembrane metalloprotease [Saprospiraceae bacterium]